MVTSKVSPYPLPIQVIRFLLDRLSVKQQLILTLEEYKFRTKRFIDELTLVNYKTLGYHKECIFYFLISSRLIDYYSYTITTRTRKRILLLTSLIISKKKKKKNVPIPRF